MSIRSITIITANTMIIIIIKFDWALSFVMIPQAIFCPALPVFLLSSLSFLPSSSLFLWMTRDLFPIKSSKFVPKEFKSTSKSTLVVAPSETMLPKSPACLSSASLPPCWDWKIYKKWLNYLVILIDSCNLYVSKLFLWGNWLVILDAKKMEVYYLSYTFILNSNRNLVR